MLSQKPKSNSVFKIVYLIVLSTQNDCSEKLAAKQVEIEEWQKKDRYICMHAYIHAYIRTYVHAHMHTFQVNFAVRALSYDVRV